MKLFGISPTPPRPKSPRRRLFEGGCVLLVLIWIGLILFTPWTPLPREPRRVSCLSSMKQIATSLSMYRQDYDDRMPFSRQWREDLSPYSRPGYTRCPEAAREGKDQYGIAFHSILSGRHIFDETLGAKALPSEIIFPESMPILFDTRLPGASASAPLLEGLASPGRHRQGDRAGNHIAFIDGHAKWFSDHDIVTLRTNLH
jgi:hypothetical protein